MLRARARTLLEHRHARIAICALTILFALPSIGMGFFADDYVLRDWLRAHGPGGRPWYDLYLFFPGVPEVNRALMAQGQEPWWSAPGIKMHFLRPLAGALFALDERTFGDHAFGWHLDSIAWYVALVAVVGALYRRFLPRATGTLALLVFALSESHYQLYAWPSARHATVATTCTLLALLAYVRDCEQQWRPGRWLCALGFAVGLGAGESALAAAAYGLAYAVIARPKTARRHTVLAGLPAAAVLATYGVVYKAMGYGVAHSGQYLDPAQSPGAFARAALTRIPIFLGNAVWSIPAELSSVLPRLPLVILGIVGAIVVARLYATCRPTLEDRERAAVRWLVPGALLALLVSSGGFPGARLLLVPDVGFAAMLGVLLRHGFQTSRPWGIRVGIARVFVGVLALLHVVLPPWFMITGALASSAVGRASLDVARNAELGPPPARVFVLVASDPSVGIYPPALLAPDRLAPGACWSLLSGAKADHRVTRSGPSTLTLEPIGTTLLRGPFEDLYRSPDDPMHVGDRSVVCGATIRVADMRQGLPSRIDVDFGVPLDAPELRLLVWQGGRLRKFTPPKFGESVALRWSMGPLGVF